MLANLPAQSRPNRIPPGRDTNRIVLRAKAFRSILQTGSGGKSTLEFKVKARAEAKADEVEALLKKYGEQKIATLDLLLQMAPMELQARLSPYNKTIADAVSLYAKHLREEREMHSTQTLGKLMDACPAPSGSCGRSSLPKAKGCPSSSSRNPTSTTPTPLPSAQTMWRSGFTKT